MIIYKVTNKINGKCYIGQTIRKLNKRINDHRKKSKNNSNFQFHQALRKYGEENFEWSILCECNSKEELNEMEFHYIKQYNTYYKGYNMTFGGDNPMNYNIHRQKISESLKGHVVSEESKNEIRKKLIGRKNPEHSKFMKENNPAKRKDVKEKISKSRKGRNWIIKSPVGDIYEFCGNVKEKIKEITGYSYYTLWINHKGMYKKWILKQG